MRRNNASKNNNVRHPLFKKCAQLETAAFWKEIFENCSVGRFPRYIDYSNGRIVYSKTRRGKSETYFIPEDPPTAIIVLKNVFRKCNNLLSANDLINKQIQQRKKLQKITLPDNMLWKDLRAPTTRLLIINLYVWKEQKRLNLTNTQADSLFMCIRIGLILGTIRNEDMILKKGTLLNVKGIKRLPNGYFAVNPIVFHKEVPLSNNSKNRQIGLGDDYHKFTSARDARIASLGL